MRILHTSDWHAGKKNNDISRKDDLIYALGEIKKIVNEEKVDCILVAGDLFDKQNPPIEVQEIIWDFFLDMNSKGVKSLIISGNHDSHDFLKSVKKLLGLANVKVFPYYEREQLFTYEKDGENVCFAAIPYIPPSFVHKIIPEEQITKDKKAAEYSEILSQIIKKLGALASQKGTAILVAHMALMSAKPSGTEKEISLLYEYSVDERKIPADFKYCALGHIHRFQKIQSPNSKIYYSGTIYQIDFGEKDEKKFVILLNVKNGNIEEREIQLDLKRTLKEFEFDLEKEKLDGIIMKLKSYPMDIKKIKLKVPPSIPFQKVVEIKNKIMKEVEFVAYLEEKINEGKTNQNIANVEIGEENIFKIYKSYFLEKGRKEEDFNKVIQKIDEIIRTQDE
jgi:exonuclease SbcD